MGKEHNSPTLFVLFELMTVALGGCGAQDVVTEFFFFGRGGWCFCCNVRVFADVACRAILSWPVGDRGCQSASRKMHIFLAVFV